MPRETASPFVFRLVIYISQPGGGTQWELLKTATPSLQPAWNELDPASSAWRLFHNDDGGVRILHLAREPGHKRTGAFTTGIAGSLRDGKSRCSLPDPRTRARTSPRC